MKEPVAGQEQATCAVTDSPVPVVERIASQSQGRDHAPPDLSCRAANYQRPVLLVAGRARPAITAALTVWPGTLLVPVIAQVDWQRLPGSADRLTVGIMTKASGAASRTAAARTADDLFAQRAAQFHEREKELHRLVTDYHHAAAQARKIHEDAQARAAKIAADAETRIAALREHADREASAFQDAAHIAVRAILQFGESSRTAASLTTLTATQVRAIERAEPSTTAARRRSTRGVRQPDDHAASPAETVR